MSLLSKCLWDRQRPRILLLDLWEHLELVTRDVNKITEYVTYYSTNCMAQIFRIYPNHLYFHLITIHSTKYLKLSCESYTAIHIVLAHNEQISRQQNQFMYSRHEYLNLRVPWIPILISCFDLLSLLVQRSINRIQTNFSGSRMCWHCYQCWIINCVIAYRFWLLDTIML